MIKLDRREFLGAIAGLGGALFLGGCGSRETQSAELPATRTTKYADNTLAVASGSDASALTRKAVDALGGMDKLVKSGDFVVVKPNIAWNQPPEVGATTNPEVVGEIVRMCKECGAGRILVIDHVIDRPAEMVLGLTGIMAAGKNAGAEVVAAQNESDFSRVEIAQGRAIKSDTCLKEILKADVFINAPIAKTHGATTLTLGMKNLMGCIWDRQSWHRSKLDQCIADYATIIRPDLTILDANRILLTGGPKGPGKTKAVGKVIAGVDPVAVDSYGAGLFEMSADDISHIRLAHEMGVGEMDLAKVTIKNV
ncbi:MAG: DUF362 domain-containing protein [Armatimonadetes bacterium]|nr:DUF362 domain-containing protein [Armatimonadota bacterium]